MKINSKGFKITGLVIGILIICVTGYNVYDNARVTVVRQKVEIADLPDSFDGFTILLLTDLHGKRFGKGQKRLVSKINDCDYDMIAITGDMMNSYGKGNVEPFYELLDGIKNKKHMFYTGGSDLVAWDHNQRPTGEKTRYGKKLEEKGAILLDRVHSVERKESKIWVAPFEPISLISHYLEEARENIKTEEDPEKLETYKLQEQYAGRLKEGLESLQPGDAVIALSHGPYATDDPSNIPSRLARYDLVIAGHYHGGQFRVPFYGALYIPGPTSSMRGPIPNQRGLFPKQEEVCGLKDWGVFQQYISKGLGASSPIPLLRFRLFNTPEINLITLVKK